MRSVAETIRDAAGAVALLEDELAKAQERIRELEDANGNSTDRIVELECELEEARATDVEELLADVRRGIRTLDEVYEEVLGS